MPNQSVVILEFPNRYTLLASANGEPFLNAPRCPAGLTTRMEVTPFCSCATVACVATIQSWLDDDLNQHHLERLTIKAIAAKLAIARLSSHLDTKPHEPQTPPFDRAAAVRRYLPSARINGRRSA